MDKADKAKEKIPSRRKLVTDAEKASVRSEKLRFGRAEIGLEEIAKSSKGKRLAVNYKALEAALQSQINNIESTHSGYDEYKYHLDEINHNPYELETDVS